MRQLNDAIIILLIPSMVDAEATSNYQTQSFRL